MRRQILQGGYVVTLGSKGILSRGTVVIEDDRIVDILHNTSFQGPEVSDCSDRLLMPGLCNAHLHSEFLLFKGLLEERRLAQWEEAPFYDAIWKRLEEPLDPELLAPAYRVSYLEQLLSGVTFVGEFNCAHNSARLSESILAEVGLRGSATIKPEESGPVAEAVPVLALHNETALTREELEHFSHVRARTPRTFLTLHAAETTERLELIKKNFDTTTIRLLGDYDLLSEYTLLSHAVYVDEEEIRILSQSGARVIASPTSEMKLSDGVSPVVAYLEAGVPVALGTDCATCNNGADMFSEMKTLGLLQKLNQGAHVLPANMLLKMGTYKGFRAFGLSDVGKLEPGFKADIIGLDRWSPSLTPLVHGPQHSNIYANLVYSATAKDVRDVLVNGSWLVRDGKHRSLDPRKLSKALQSATDRLYEAYNRAAV